MVTIIIMIPRYISSDLFSNDSKIFDKFENIDFDSNFDFNSKHFKTILITNY